MTRFGKIVAGSIVSAALTLAMSGVALAAPVTSTTAGPPSTTAGTTGTAVPSTTQPSTTQPSTPSTTAPSTTAPPQNGLSKSLTRTATEIWWIVRPHHVIDCARASKQLKRIGAADAAAAKRLSAWQGRNSADAKAQGKRAAVRVKHTSDKVRVFQKLEKDGQALIARIDAKCGSANSSK